MAEINAEVEKLFDFRYEFQKCGEWVLPPVDVLFKEDIWMVDRLMSIKKDLNDTKALLNDMGLEWHVHTSKIDKAQVVRSTVKGIVPPSFFSNAWCKFFEIISTFPLLPSGSKNNFTSFHLCEAPGGFISALHYYLCLKFGTNFKWKWYANSLNPYYEGHSVKKAVVDDRLLFPTLDKWHFGSDDTGDILNLDYHLDLHDFLQQQKFSVDLITADGGVDCMENPGEQESFVANLKFAEVVLALDNLNVGGCCVLKRFTLFESISICTMYILNCAFHKVYVFKPVTSKCGNSEVYVVCLGYFGKQRIAPYISEMQKHIGNLNSAIIPVYSIPTSFIDQIVKCGQLFADRQVYSIKENLDLYSNMTTEKKKQLHEMQALCVKLYFEKFSLKQVNARVNKLFSGKKFARSSYGSQVYNLKSLYFKTTSSSYNQQQVKKTMVWEDLLHDVEKRLDECFSKSSKKRKREAENSWFHFYEISRSMKDLHDGWIVTGKKFPTIINSKFCNPMLLYLWNEISGAEQVKSISCSSQPSYEWKWDSSQCLVAGSCALQRSDVLICMESCDDGDRNDLLRELTSLCGNGVKVCFWKSAWVTCTEFLSKYKTFVLDTTVWDTSSLHQETNIKCKLIETLHSIIKCLTHGDCLVICIQSILTRFTAGMLFIILSLFNAVSPLLPEPTSPPSSGQLWILCDFNSHWLKENVLNYLQYILNLEKEQKTVLEIVPMNELCASQFFDVLLDLNNRSLSQRLKSLITAAKLKAKVTTQEVVET